MLYQLGVETAETRKPGSSHQLTIFFRNYQAGRDTVVIVDRRSSSGMTRSSRKLRLLMNFQTDDRFLVTLVLIGSTELGSKVHRLKHLDQRITLRYHLKTLDPTHTASYIGHRLQMAGQTIQIFTPEAVKLIFDFTRGTPREINNVCDVALLVGYSKRVKEIGEKVIAEVIKDMVGVA